MKKTNTKKAVDTTYVEKAIGLLILKSGTKDAERESQQTSQRKKCIDDGDYSQTLQKFEREASIKKAKLTTGQYLQWLQDNEKRYGNSSFYHIQWSSNNLGDEHKKIFDFINKEIDENLNFNDDSKKKTLLSKFSEEQLKILYKSLLEGEYISKQTKENTFIYNLSGEPLKGIPKIKWEKSKKKAVYLLDKTCVTFSFKTMNNCIETKFKDFDSNDRKKIGFSEIEDILEAIQ